MEGEMTEQVERRFRNLERLELHVDGDRIGLLPMPQGRYVRFDDVLLALQSEDAGWCGECGETGGRHLSYCYEYKPNREDEKRQEAATEAAKRWMLAHDLDGYLFDHLAADVLSAADRVVPPNAQGDHHEFPPPPLDLPDAPVAPPLDKSTGGRLEAELDAADQPVAVPPLFCGSDAPNPTQQQVPDQEGKMTIATVSGSGSGPPLKPTPKWRRELRLLKRDGPIKYVRVLRALRRFHRAVDEMERTEGGHNA
jgi:hypothetical protein